MNISSMTGFSKISQPTLLGSLDWEMRSVNHRYCETFFRLPDLFRPMEMELRARAQKTIKRGKIDIVLQFSPAVETSTGFAINDTLLASLSGAIAQVRQAIPDAHINVMDLLRWNDLLKTRSLNADELSEIVFSSFENAIAQLMVAREREGQSLQKILLEQCESILSEIRKITARFPQVIARERNRILDRFQELALSVDKDRLEQEMVWLMQKADIAEELQRIGVHITEVHRVLNEGGVVGRRLDFLLQELNREVNTIASKSIDVETTQSTVEMKVSIEQMREQVQNVE